MVNSSAEPVKMTKRIVIGMPDSGKTTYVKQFGTALSGCPKDENFPRQLMKSESFYLNYENLNRFVREYIKNTQNLLMDEPFYFLLMYQDGLIGELAKKDFLIATHKIAYFLLLDPEITLLDNKSAKTIGTTELQGMIETPDEKFFESDVLMFHRVLKNFGEISEKIPEIVLSNKYLREIRTTYVVRDYMVELALGQTKTPSEYLDRIFSFFRKNYGSLNIGSKRIIDKVIFGV